MKRINLFLIIASIGIVVTSCSKDDSIVQTTDQPPTPQYATPPDDYDRYWWDNDEIPGVDGEDFGCDWGSGACAQEDFVLIGAARDQTGDIIDEVILNNASHTQEVFANNETFLKGIFPDNYIDRVINGEITVRYRGVFVLGHTSYFTFIESDEVIFVQPVK